MALSRPKYDYGLNLCYNCGNTHLPFPCVAPLRRCELCHCLGHMDTFCHLGVKKKHPDYAYVMLCHNCDGWHLPAPCVHPPHRCAQCGEMGHVEFFCPRAPVLRGSGKELIKMHEEIEKGSNKRKHTADGSDVEAAVVAYVKSVLTEEHVRTIRLNTAKDVIHLLKTRTASQILEFFGRPSDAPVLPPLIGQSLHGVGDVGGAAFGSNNNNRGHSLINYTNPPGHATVPAPNMALQSHTTPPGSDNQYASTPHSNINPGTYASMHDRFGRGEFGMQQSAGQQQHNTGITQRGGSDYSGNTFSRIMQPPPANKASEKPSLIVKLPTIRNIAGIPATPKTPTVKKRGLSGQTYSECREKQVGEDGIYPYSMKEALLMANQQRCPHPVGQDAQATASGAPSHETTTAPTAPTSADEGDDDQALARLIAANLGGEQHTQAFRMEDLHEQYTQTTPMEGDHEQYAQASQMEGGLEQYTQIDQMEGSYDPAKNQCGVTLPPIDASGTIIEQPAPQRPGSAMTGLLMQHDTPQMVPDQHYGSDLPDPQCRPYTNLIPATNQQYQQYNTFRAKPSQHYESDFPHQQGRPYSNMMPPPDQQYQQQRYSSQPAFHAGGPSMAETGGHPMHMQGNPALEEWLQDVGEEGHSQHSA